MMENNKYYTPKIEEFCIGFECEYYNRYSKNWVPMIVEESNYYVDDIGGPEEDYIFKGDYGGHDKTFRVKYIDLTEIESLGFIRDSIYSHKLNQDYYIEYNCEKPIHRDTIEIKNNEQTLFSGYIKNKNELKKLMKQLNII